MPFTKHNFLVTNPDDIPRVIAVAFHIATTGRPGPVLVDIAKDAALLAVLVSARQSAKVGVVSIALHCVATVTKRLEVLEIV
jgi:thiamine pyrophosphate-dependent acetolactate synthase large subunit-like protein